MDYELAKILKDAGFPQESSPNGGSYHTRDLTEKEIDERWDCFAEEPVQTIEDIYLPTLSELIEACGERFDYVGITKNDLAAAVETSWTAMSIKEPPLAERQTAIQTYGENAEEAVARLWIALNKK